MGIVNVSTSLAEMFVPKALNPPLFASRVAPKVLLRVGSLPPGPPPPPPTGVGETALLVTAIIPFAPPRVFGVKVTLKIRLWLTASVSGRFKPLSLNPAPLTVTWERFSLLLLALVRVSDFV
jgi:hypothetical protein